MCICVCACVCVGGAPVSCPLVHIKLTVGGTSLVVQWLRLHASPAGGSVSVQGAEIPHAEQGRKKKKKQLNVRLCGGWRLV